MQHIELSKNLDIFSLKNWLDDLRANVPLKLSLGAFTITAFAFNESGYMPAFAMLLGFLTLIKGPQFLFRKAGKLPPELVLLNIWLIWAVFTGLFVAKDHELLYSGLRSLVLMIAFLNLLYLVISYDPKLVKIVIMSLFLSGMINYLAIQFGFQPEEFMGKERLYGLTSNPNSLGVKTVYATFALFLTYPFLKLRASFRLLFLLVIFVVFFSIIISSGSRKAFISFIFLLGVYLFISNANRKNNLYFTIGAIKLLLFAPFLYYFSTLLLEDTIMVQRFLEFNTSGGLESNIRTDMVRFGLELTLDHPLAGVGLGNYKAYSPWGMHSHNDYIESLTNTGIIGFLLYQSAWVITILRAIRLVKVTNLPLNRFYMAMIVVGILLVKVIGLGQLTYIQPSGMILIMTFASYTWLIEKNISKKYWSL